MILFCSSSTTSPPQKCTKISWNCMPLIPPTWKPLLLRIFMKKQMFWLQTLLLSALNHQKNLQSHVQWELKSLLLTWNGHNQKKSSSLHYIENEWSVCSVISYDENSNTIKAHLLQAIKTRAKDDTGKTYWIYREE